MQDLQETNANLRQGTQNMLSEQEFQLEEDHNGDVWYQETADRKTMKVSAIRAEKLKLEALTREEHA